MNSQTRQEPISRLQRVFRAVFTKHPGGKWTIASFIIGLILLAPALTVLFNLFAPSGDVWAHLLSTVLPTYIVNTLLLMVSVGLLSAFAGVSTAWLTVTMDFPGRRFFSWALILPLATPAYIVAYVYTDLLEYAGPLQTALRTATGWGYQDYYFPPIRSLGGAALMLSLVLYPYIYLLARASFQRQSVALIEAARSLRASPWKVFWRVALPTARPAVAGGMALVLMETIADFGVVDFFGVQTLTTGVFRTWFSLGDPQAAGQIAAWLFIFAVALVLLEQQSRRGQVANATSRDRAITSSKMSPAKGVGAALFCALPILFGFVVPTGILINLTILTGDPLLGRSFFDFVSNSVVVASLAALLACFIGIILAYAARLHPTKFNQTLIRLATLGYALPGAMLAIGILSLSTWLDSVFANSLKSLFGVTPGLLLTGTIGGLLFAYVCRFLTVAYNGVESGLQKVHGSLDFAARSLGAGPTRVLTAIHLPMIRGSLISAMLLVFIDVMKELPATLLLRPFNFETLATRVYRLASDERLPEASTAALVIVLVGLVPTIVLSISLARSNRWQK
ncbi:MAG: iron ABC transporter permease [Parvibaculaceae bacterium]|nr:iron ABC transporter permease [Parvibaculaceae bacterium]